MADELTEQQILDAELRGACRGWFSMANLFHWEMVEHAFIAGYHYALDQQKSPGTTKG